MAHLEGTWIVIGGADKGGILVRKSEELSSEALEERLEYGALLQEEELKGSRLRYRKIYGKGPEIGWISTKIHGKELVTRVMPPHLTRLQGARGHQLQLGEPELTFYAISDVHVELKENMHWLNNLPSVPNSCIIVAGDLGVSLTQVRHALQVFKQKFTYVFYCYGNHETWCHKSLGDEDYRPVADSFDKLELLKDICIQEEIFISPQLLHNVWVVPVLGWYHRSWDTEPPLQAPPGQELQHPPLPGEKFATDTGACKWRGFANASTELAESLDQQNQLWGIWPLPVALEENLKQPRGERKSWVISFSHFLPELELMPEKRFLFTPNLTHIVGSSFIRKRVRLLQPDLHIFGHSHFPWDMTLADGVRYKSWPLGTPAEQARRISSYPSKEIEEWHPLPVFDSLGRHYPTGPACWYSLMYTRLRRDPQSYRMASFVADVYCPEAPRVPESILSPGGLIPLEDQEQLERRERYAGKSAASMKREMNNWARAS